MKNTKQKILDALEEKRKIMLCPLCKHENFIRKTYDRVNIIDNGNTLKDEIIEYDIKGKTYICQKCNEDITEEELIREKI